MADEQMTTAQALGILRRARQTLRFLEGVEEAATVVSRYQEQMGGLEQALIDKRQDMVTLEQDALSKALRGITSLDEVYSTVRKTEYADVKLSSIAPSTAPTRTPALTPSSPTSPSPS